MCVHSLLEEIEVKAAAYFLHVNTSCLHGIAR